MHSLRKMVEATGTTERTIRFWEQQGLLGKVARTSGGQRTYTSEQLEIAQRIAMLSLCHIPLAEMHPYLEGTSQSRNAAVARVLRDHIKQANDFLQSLEKELENDRAW